MAWIHPDSRMSSRPKRKRPETFPAFCPDCQKEHRTPLKGEPYITECEPCLDERSREWSERWNAMMESMKG